MTEKKYTKHAWIKALKGLRSKYRIFVPVKDGDFHTFKLMDEEKTPDLSYQNSRLSPKSMVYPQSERMFEYTLDEANPGGSVYKEAPKDYSPQMVVGIRPCDAHAFQIVKRNFDNPEYRDPWWVGRFESVTLVGLGCHEPCSTCFCSSVGGGPFSDKGLDVLLYDLGESMVARAVTLKGEEWLKQADGGEPVDEPLRKGMEEISSAAVRKISSTVATESLKDKVSNELFDAPFWEEVAFACLNCGTCTYLCPTCWCFDIQDEVFGREGDRMRNWDSCMFPLFTLHGSGHNPRDKKFQRVRQRFMHKLKYYVDKYKNGVQCSGCGRCVRYCPVNIDIRQVAELMSNY